MGIPDVGSLSLGEWVAISRHWDKAHGGAQVEPPSEDEFEQAILSVRGVH